MRNFRLWISYDGTDFAGWQRQAGVPTIQEELERAISTVCQVDTCVHGSGRTDSGVHALGQCAHVRLDRGPRAERLARALNSTLPSAIRVWHAAEVPDEFHARFSACGKRYLYQVLQGPCPLPQFANQAYYCGYELDLVAMRDAAQCLLGEHDFLAFSANPGVPRVRPTIRTIRSFHIHRRRGRLVFVLQGNGFLYHMVRILVGSLLEVGRGYRDPSWVGEVLEARQRTLAGPTLPAQGLFLLRPLYPPRFGREPRLWEPPRHG